jgi:hypothetical protein
MTDSEPRARRSWWRMVLCFISCRLRQLSRTPKIKRGACAAIVLEGRPTMSEGAGTV